MSNLLAVDFTLQARSAGAPAERACRPRPAFTAEEPSFHSEKLLMSDHASINGFRVQG
jgi:hypothetical protein